MVPENQNVQQQKKQVPQTPTSVFRISTRLSRPYECVMFQRPEYKRTTIDIEEKYAKYLLLISNP
jgi:hypothetical protein